MQGPLWYSYMHFHLWLPALEIMVVSSSFDTSNDTIALMKSYNLFDEKSKTAFKSCFSYTGFEWFLTKNLPQTCDHLLWIDSPTCSEYGPRLSWTRSTKGTPCKNLPYLHVYWHAYDLHTYEPMYHNYVCRMFIFWRCTGQISGLNQSSAHICVLDRIMDFICIKVVTH
mgnify:CR=1 FL=1